MYLASKQQRPQKSVLCHQKCFPNDPFAHSDATRDFIFVGLPWMKSDSHSAIATGLADEQCHGRRGRFRSERVWQELDVARRVHVACATPARCFP